MGGGIPNDNNIAVPSSENSRREDDVMSADQVQRNKQIVANFFAAQTDPSLNAFQDFAPDIRFWIAGDKSSTHSAIAGLWEGPEKIAELGRRIGRVVDKFNAMDIKHVTAEDDRVAVEAEGFIVVKGGAIYNNSYHFLFIIRDGKIQEIKEYLDTVLVNEFFGLAADVDAMTD